MKGAAAPDQSQAFPLVCCFLTAGEGEEGRPWRRNLLRVGRNESPALKNHFIVFVDLFFFAVLLLVKYYTLYVWHHAVRVQMGYLLNITAALEISTAVSVLEIRQHLWTVRKQLNSNNVHTRLITFVHHT